MIAVAAGVVVLMFVPPTRRSLCSPCSPPGSASSGSAGTARGSPTSPKPPRRHVGLTLGAAMAINQLGIIAAPPLLGLVHDLTGGYTALWGCSSWCWWWRMG